MSIKRTIAGRAAALAVLGLLLATDLVQAQEPLRVGLILPYSGPFADLAAQMDYGVQVYVKQHGDVVAGRKVEILKRDTGGPNPDIAKRLAQELIVRDKVDLITGVLFTPNAMAIAPVVTEAKKPFVIMNAATSIITTRSPYIVRLSFTLPQVVSPLGGWAAKNGIKKVYTLVSDYGPGHDSEIFFKKAFTEAGGQIVGEVRVPLRNPDFTPYVQRIKDIKPDAVFVFLPSGEQPVTLLKSAVEKGLLADGIRLIGSGDLTEDGVLEGMGDPALGVITSGHYSYAHESPENAAFVKAFEATFPNGPRPNLTAIGAYDGMAAIYAAIKAQNGKLAADPTIDFLKTYKAMSPRGPIEIDPETRDIVQTIYIRKVERKAGKLVTVEFQSYPKVKDPGK
ncbi:MAG: ABC transporter substrate-binding protein [Rhodospirillales bacterium]|nr:ABC transporter substrate-binding protein [Rhodospirillales bacterium]